MSKTSSFSYGNTTKVSRSHDDYALGMFSNYVRDTKKSKDDSFVYQNMTAPSDHCEYVTYQYRTHEKQFNTNLTIPHPTYLPGCVEYVVKVEELLATVNDTTGEEVDEPITMYLTIKHPVSGNITTSIVTEVFDRLKGACQKDDGTFRWGELMRLAMEPKAD